MCSFQKKTKKALGSSLQPMADGSWSEMSQLSHPSDENILRQAFYTVSQPVPLGLNSSHPVLLA